MSDFEPTSETASEEDVKLTFKERVISELKFFAGLAFVMVALVTFAWGHFKIPSESMVPTLEVGDHIYVSKWAYGYSRDSLPGPLAKLPIPDGRVFGKLPKRGDIAVFSSPRDSKIVIKRIVALPGDTVQMKAGRLYLNGDAVPIKKTDAWFYRDHRFEQVRSVTVFEETLPGSDETHLIYERGNNFPLDQTAPITIPEGFLFAMGDNRDGSGDSRDPIALGLIPTQNLMGRADRMMFSFKRCKDEDGLRCPGSRWMLKL